MQIEALARLVPALEGSEVAITPLPGGITNRNYRVEAAGGAYVLRIGGERTELLGIDRAVEHACSLAAARAGVAPEVIGFLPERRLLVTRFVQGRVLFDPAGTQHTPGAGAGYLGVFLAAMFMSLFVIFGFDTAGSLGEETVNPSREAPRGILLSIGLSFVAGLIFLGAAILAIKSVPAVMANTNPLPFIIDGAFGSGWGKVYLAVVSIAIFVCTLAIQAAGIRLIFSMARDGRLPGSRIWSQVHPRFGTPVWAALAAGVLAALPLLVSQQIATLAIGATGLIYLSYFATNLVVLQARGRVWPERGAAFSLGRWALLINLAALLYGGAMLINFAWPRPASNPPFSSVATWAASWPLIGGAPLLELYVVLLLVVGGAYWYAVQRHRPDRLQSETPTVEPNPMTIGGP